MIVSVRCMGAGDGQNLLADTQSASPDVRLAAIIVVRMRSDWREQGKEGYGLVGSG